MTWFKVKNTRVVFILISLFALLKRKKNVNPKGMFGWRERNRMERKGIQVLCLVGFKIKNCHSKWMAIHPFWLNHHSYLGWDEWPFQFVFNIFFHNYPSSSFLIISLKYVFHIYISTRIWTYLYIDTYTYICIFI